jgi:flagellar FliJ protein
MKFKFQLEKVLRHRKILEDLAQKDFQEAMAELQKQTDLLHALREAKGQARENSFLQQSQTGGQVSESLKQIHDFITLQDIRIENQLKKIAECEKGVESRREILRQKAIDTKILKRLEENKQRQFIQEQQRSEQKEMDDNANMRFASLKQMKE